MRGFHEILTDAGLSCLSFLSTVVNNCQFSSGAGLSCLWREGRQTQLLWGTGRHVINIIIVMIIIIIIVIIVIIAIILITNIIMLIRCAPPAAPFSAAQSNPVTTPPTSVSRTALARFLIFCPLYFSFSYFPT